MKGQSLSKAPHRRGKQKKEAKTNKANAVLFHLPLNPKLKEKRHVGKPYLKLVLGGQRTPVVNARLNWFEH